MEYSKIISVTGLPGLFELVGNKGDGAIVKSLESKLTRYISGRLHNFSSLESIEIFTTHDNVNLVEVLKAMQANADVALPDEKNTDALKAYFGQVFPSIDLERVYPSDMKKMIRWHKILSKESIVLELTSKEKEEESEADNS